VKAARMKGGEGSREGGGMEGGEAVTESVSVEGGESAAAMEKHTV